MMKTSLRCILAGFASCTILYANASPLQPKSVDELTGQELSAQYYAYPYTDSPAPALTPAPDGYEPFHIEHYGRHGSRWLIDQRDYEYPVAELEKAERNGYLTPLGKETLELLRDIAAKEQGRCEELTDMGALQHQLIGERMVRNFPQVFAPGSTVNAKSTIVIRCILSMVNELNSINKLAPGVKVLADASNADMRYMNFDDTTGVKIRKAAKKKELKKFQAKYPEKGVFLTRLITNPEFIRDSIDNSRVERRLWRVLSNMQSHIGMPWLTDRVFSREEQHGQWMRSNANWFVEAGNSKLTKNRAQYSQRHLLRNFIESADTAVASPRVSANLRFGHDGMVLPLTVLMEINDYAREINSLDQLEQSRWYCQDIIPMAANIQMIFYRPTDSTATDDVLVKVLLNENEIVLPGTPVSGPYYRWKDLRKYYLEKLDSFKE
ncbi:histidine-type phosphatase [Muribaculum intestinale]|uniref:histidine-type phosphatase n=1 Tax=Muribaculum intestinale TaxID=1796646 RepID=UPI00242B80FC|nr:histidine-type phosphatase [Muribaculum intestinale]